MHLAGLSNWRAPYLSVDNLAGYNQPVHAGDQDIFYATVLQVA